MFRKSFLTAVISAAVILLLQVAISAQTAPVTGKLVVKKADGTTEPVVGALIEVYRTDIKAGAPSGKTNKKGEFSFAGMMLGADYVFSISGPNIAPAIYPNVKAGMDNLLITVVPGDGHKYTEAEIRKGSVAGAVNTEVAEPVESEERKKEREEIERKNAEIVAKNEKVTKTNEVIAQAFKEGNAAFTAGDFDLAITKYDAGLAADPEFLGSVPTLTNNRSAALAARAVATYNKAAKMTEPAERNAAFAKVKQDLSDAAAGFQHSWDLLKTPPPPAVMDAAQYEKVRTAALRGAMDAFEKAVRTKQVDDKIIETAKVLVPEFISTENDAAKKRAANLDLGDLYRIHGDSENAVAEYQKILETSPDDLEALSGAGFSLVNIGYVNNDKDKLQQGANMLQRFASLAPDTNKYKADAVGLLETLKAEQNVAPQKTAGGRKKQ